MRKAIFIAAMALASISLIAHADSFTFTFGSSFSPFSGSGVLTTGVLEAPEEYLIASVTGTVATTPGGPSLAINSVLNPGTFPTISNGGTFPANDNVLFVNNGVGSLDGNGLALILRNGAQINLYNPEGSPDDALLERVNGTTLFENVSTSITGASAVPEPSTLILLATGLLGCVGLVKRRR